MLFTETIDFISETETFIWVTATWFHFSHRSIQPRESLINTWFHFNHSSIHPRHSIISTQLVADFIKFTISSIFVIIKPIDVLVAFIISAFSFISLLKLLSSSFGVKSAKIMSGSFGRKIISYRKSMLNDSFDCCWSRYSFIYFY